MNMKKIIPLALIIFAMSSCNKYYKATLGNTSENSIKTIDSLANAGRYFIFRNASQAFAMNNLVINKEEKVLLCNLSILPVQHQVHLTKGINGKMRYKEQDDDQLDATPVLNEAHLYNSASKNNVNAGPYTLPLSQIQKIEIIEKDRPKTAKSKILGLATIAVAGGLVVGICALIVGAGSIF